MTKPALVTRTESEQGKNSTKSTSTPQDYKNSLLESFKSDTGFILPQNACYCPPFQQVSTILVNKIEADFVYDQLYTADPRANIVVFFGEHGVGSSFMARRTVVKADERTNNIIPLFIDCRLLRHLFLFSENNNDSLADTCMNVLSIDNIIFDPNTVKYLIVFDGLDDSTVNKVCELLKAQKKFIEKGDLKVIITTASESVRKKIDEDFNNSTYKCGTFNMLLVKHEIIKNKLNLHEANCNLELLRVPYYFNLYRNQNNKPALTSEVAFLDKVFENVDSNDLKILTQAAKEYYEKKTIYESRLPY